MSKHKLMYSCGLSPESQDEDEMLIDVETMEGCIREKDKPMGDVWMILTGQLKAGGGYVKPKISVKNLHNRFMDLLNACGGMHSVAIHKLMKEYGFKPLGYYPGKYPHRYCVQD